MEPKVTSNTSTDKDFLLGQRYLSHLVEESSQSLSGYETNPLFHNLGGGHFQEVSGVVGGNSQLDGRAVAYGDLDNDGDLDLVVSNRNFPHISVFRNDLPAEHRFIALKLEGNASNRMGIGTKITATCGPNTLTRDATLGKGFISQNTPFIWLGLQDCTILDQLTVDWPSGQKQVFQKIPTNQKLHVIEGHTRLTSLLVNPRNFNSHLVPPTLSKPSGHSLISEKKVPPWQVRDLTGRSVNHQSFQDDLLVLNFWATWCIPCQKEMKDLEALYQTNSSSQLKILGISLDAPENQAKVKRFLKHFYINYPIAIGDSSIFEAFQNRLGLKDAGIPLTVMIHQGKITKFYSGPVTFETLHSEISIHLKKSEK